MAEAFDTKHPDYVDRADEWRLMRDAHRGEKAVKEAGDHYLPMPSGFRALQDGGVAMYAAYQKRAQFPEILAPTVSGMTGIIHRTETQIEMPDAMLGLWERATRDGLPLEALHNRITAELLTTGRYSLLVDAASEGSELPFIAGYSAEALINWSDDRTMFVLDESGLVRNGFEWEAVPRFRALELVDGAYQQRIFERGSLLDTVAPTIRGGGRISEIPFVVMGAHDLSLDPEVPPLIGVSRAAIAMYQLSADYRWQLFMTGQETLFVINADKPDTVGAGVIVQLEGNGEQQPDAKYVGPAGTGIEAHRIAINDEKEVAAQAGARLFDSEGRSQESGEARRMRFSAQTASLVTVSQASAKGLEKALRYVAIMIGADPQEVVVKPNLSFIDSTLSPDEVLAVIKGWQEGGYSYETMYERLQRGEAVSAERTAEEELKLLDKEELARSYSLDEAGVIPMRAAE